MEKKYAWAVNQLKLARAVNKANDKVKADNALLKAQGKELIEASEELVKEYYVEMGGLLKKDAPEVSTNVEEGVKKIVVKRKK